MAITKITAPGVTPSAFWPEVINQLAINVLNIEKTIKFIGGVIRQGSIFNIGGILFFADADTSITGSASDYVKLTVSGNVALASYVADFSGASWNGSYNGWYDADGNEYFNVPQIMSQYHTGKKTVLTGTGYYTVPMNVYQLSVRIIGPGEDGTAGTPDGAGSGGASGEELNLTIDVTPGEVFAFNISTSYSFFGTYVARKGYGYKGDTGSGHGGNYAPGGNGGGYRSGSGGDKSNGGNAIAGYGGGGGGGGASFGAYSYPGGLGAIGTIEII